jgi:hypothetical protein
VAKPDIGKQTLIAIGEPREGAAMPGGRRHAGHSARERSCDGADPANEAAGGNARGESCGHSYLLDGRLQPRSI